MADDPDPLLNGRYRLLRKIGVGGMAAVYVAEDSVLDREVAVKRLHAGSPEDAVRRFRREAHLAAGLSHPNLVSIFDAFSDRDELVVVMEYVPGPDLSAALKQHPPSEQRGLRILSHLAAAIDHVHDAGIVHRDIKPSNVLLSPDGERAKLTDLGIARVIEDTATTQAHAVPGSVPYMSPEQLSGEVVGPPSDIYSFALVAYEVLSGRRARTGTRPQISYEGASGAIPDIRDVRPQTPPAAAAVLREAMVRDPQQRPGNAVAIVDRLRRALEADAASTRPASAALPPVSDPRPREGERADPEPVSTPAAPSAAPARAARPDRRMLAAMAAAALIVAALVAVLVASGGDEPGSGGSAGSGQAEAPQEDGSAADGGVTSEAAGDPARAVRDFYEAAAEGDLEAATAVASPALEAQLGGPEGVASTFSTLETISFERIGTSTETAGRAEVEFETTAEHTDRTERCSGRATLLRDGGDWLVDRLAGVSCEVVD
jgi:hypothetical protein